MTQAEFSRRVGDAMRLTAPFLRFERVWSERADRPGICDFAFGNPHDMPLAAFSEALQRHAEPENRAWYAYKMSERKATEVVAATLRERTGLAFEPEDIAMTNGAFGALAVTLGALADPGDEVIYVSPPWFFYEAMIAAVGASPVRVDCDPVTYDLDLGAIEAAITERTRAIIVNSPNNPTGKIYPPETLRGLADILTRASERNGRRVVQLSDEAYNRIVFDERDFPSPVTFYPASLLIYTYGKTLLTPGQRIGYIAIPPAMPGREDLRAALFMAQVITGWAFPNALLQHALPDLETLSIDIGQLQARRDRMVGALREIGYELHVPEGTFYLLVKSPWADDVAFCDLLAEYDILCLPGDAVEMPGTFRISLTANDEMIERGIPGFAAAYQEAVAAPERMARAEAK